MGCMGGLLLHACIPASLARAVPMDADPRFLVLSDRIDAVCASTCRRLQGNVRLRGESSGLGLEGGPGLGLVLSSTGETAPLRVLHAPRQLCCATPCSRPASEPPPPCMQPRIRAKPGSRAGRRLDRRVPSLEGWSCRRTGAPRRRGTRAPCLGRSPPSRRSPAPRTTLPRLRRPRHPQTGVGPRRRARASPRPKQGPCQAGHGVPRAWELPCRARAAR